MAAWIKITKLVSEVLEIFVQHVSVVTIMICDTTRVDEGGWRLLAWLGAGQLPTRTVLPNT